MSKTRSKTISQTQHRTTHARADPRVFSVALQEDVEAVFCCVGGGGLLAGVGAFLKAVKPSIKVRGGKGGIPDPQTKRQFGGWVTG